VAPQVRSAQFCELVWLSRASVQLDGREIGSLHNTHGYARGEQSGSGLTQRQECETKIVSLAVANSNCLSGAL